jgi:hypothetical protein
MIGLTHAQLLPAFSTVRRNVRYLLSFHKFRRPLLLSPFPAQTSKNTGGRGASSRLVSTDGHYSILAAHHSPLLPGARLITHSSLLTYFSC